MSYCVNCGVELDDSARINTPSTLNGNWSWRIEYDLNEEITKTLLDFATIYKRKREN